MVLTFSVGNERVIALFLLFESTVLAVLIGVVRFCCTFWAKKKIQDKGLGSFLAKRVSVKSFCVVLLLLPLLFLIITPLPSNNVPFLLS